MSGGYFDYQQFRFDSVADDLVKEIGINEKGYKDYVDKEYYGYDESGVIKEKPKDGNGIQTKR